MVRGESTSFSVDRAMEEENILDELALLAKELEISQERGNLIILVVNEPYLRDLAVDFIGNKFRLKEIKVTNGKQISGIIKDEPSDFDVCLWQLPESVGSDILNALNYRRELFYETRFPNVVICNEGVLDAIVREAPDFWRYKASYHILKGIKSMAQSISDLPELGLYNTREDIIRQIKINDYLQERAVSDSQRAFLFFEGAQLHQTLGEYKTAIAYYSNSLEIFRKIGDLHGAAMAYLQLGTIDRVRGDYEKALSYYQESLKIAEELGDKREIAQILHNIGIIHRDRGDYGEALKKYEESLKIKEELGDKRGIASTLHNIGNVHYAKGDYGEALKKYEESLKIEEELGDKRGIASTLHNIGNVHHAKGDYGEALKKYEESLKIEEELGDKRGIASTLHNIGNVHHAKGDYGEALKKYEESLKIKEELGDKRGIAQILHNIGNVHYDRGDYGEALKKYEESLKIKEELGDKLGIAQTLGQKSKIHFERKEFKQAAKLNIIVFVLLKYLESPQIKIIISDLQKIKEAIGEQEFNKLSEEVMPEVNTYLKQQGLQINT